MDSWSIGFVANIFVYVFIVTRNPDFSVLKDEILIVYLLVFTMTELGGFKTCLDLFCCIKLISLLRTKCVAHGKQ